MERSVERRYERERRDFVGMMLGTGQGGGECCGKAKGEVNPSTLGKTTSLKYKVVVVVVFYQCVSFEINDLVCYLVPVIYYCSYFKQLIWQSFLV